MVRPLVLVIAWIFVVLPSGSVPTDDDVSALTAFKRAVTEDPLSRMSDWNALSGDPCGWSGVGCSGPRNRVISLRLSNSSLKGFLTPELGSLTSLQELILGNNMFLGTIPKQIGMLKSLIVLDLNANQLMGSIPPEIGGLTSITKINLQFNSLTGPIPSELGNLVSLVELHLDRNKLSGQIPGSNSSKLESFAHGKSVSRSNNTGLCQLPHLEVADFSFNFFVGQIPSCLKYLPRSSFQGNCFHDTDSTMQRSISKCISIKGKDVAKETYLGSTGEHKHKILGQPKWLLIVEVVTGSIIVMSLISFAAATVRRCQPKPSVIIPWKRTSTREGHISISIDDELLKNVLKLSRQELEIACEDFSNIIGSSPDSKMYKGTMKDGPEVAVISLCISEYHWMSDLEHYFKTRVADSARLNHENIAKLLGYCRESDPFSRMLIFEYAPNGTLYEHLHYSEGYQLSWLRRMKIAIGVARGLRYLHTELQPPFTMSELNSSGVYLTEEFSPKLVDFESWKTIHSKLHDSGFGVNGSSFHVKGNAFHGIEALESRHMDVQENVFAFGVLLLELISGRPPYSKNKGSLLDWAMPNLQDPERTSMLVDPELKNVKADELAIVCSVVSLCIDPEPSKRPSMQIICAMLEDGIDTSSMTAILKDSSMSWAQLALSS